MSTKDMIWVAVIAFVVVYAVNKIPFLTSIAG